MPKNLGSVANDVRFKLPLDHVQFLAVLVSNKDGELHLRDLDGTWIVAESDIIEMTDWEGPSVKIDGRQVRVSVRADATVRQIREFKMMPSDRPLTFPKVGHSSSVLGAAELAMIAQGWAAKLGFTPGDELGDEEPHEPHPSGSCWESGDAFHYDCSADDCQE
jgi:hypothetical protein